MRIASPGFVLIQFVVVVLAFTPGYVRAGQADGSTARGDEDEQHVYSVGHSIRTLNVPGAPSPALKIPGGEARPVQVHLWYPAAHAPECERSGAVGTRGEGDRECPTRPTEYRSRLWGLPLLPQWNPLSWAIGSSKSFEDARIEADHSPFPVIVFSPGNQTNVIDYAYTLEALASHGFIVVAPDHVNNTLDDVWIDFIDSQAKATVIPCFDGLPSPCSRADLRKSFTDRAHDVSAVIDALPAWFGDRADASRVGVMGHSRGTIDALISAGGTTAKSGWNLQPDARVKAIMGLAIGTAPITANADVANVSVPALLVAGELDTTGPPDVSRDAFQHLGSTEKAFVLIPRAMHRHFESGACAETQSAGGMACGSPSCQTPDPRAILDLRTLRTFVVFPSSGVAMNICGPGTFTTPVDVRTLVSTLSGFDFTTTSVPTTGLDLEDATAQVVQLAVAFFGDVLDPDRGDRRPLTDVLPASNDSDGSGTQSRE